MSKSEITVLQLGMSDSHPMNLKDGQYPIMLNGNIQTDISSAITLTNEHSNILCNNFPAGTKVIGTLYVPQDGITYVWLTDPTDPTKDQIGYLTEYSFTDFNDFAIPNPCSDCTPLNQEDTPLEQIEQTPTCLYTPIAVSSCLNFSIDNPVRSGVYKKDNCGNSLYFTDKLNPMRFLKTVFDNVSKTWKLDNSQRVIDHYEGTCEGVPNTVTNDQCQQLSNPNIQCICCEPIYDSDETAVDCDKIRLFPKTSHICVEEGLVVEGGSLRAGTYQIAACYASSTGERATRTFSASNPVSIFDRNQTLTSETSYVTNYGIKFVLDDLEPSKYSYIDIFIIGTINHVTSCKKFTTVDITKLKNNTLEYVLSSFELGEDVPIDDVFQVFPVYETADTCTSAGNTLLWANLKGPRDLNLQRAVIGMSSGLRWVTSETEEDFYSDGGNAASYRSYLRDEVYPLGIVFERDNTLDTCAYPFIGRDLNTALLSLQLDPYEHKYTFSGTWIPFKNYDEANSLYPADVVFFDGNYYVATGKSGPDTTVSQPDSLINWDLIGTSLNSILCVNDDEDVIGDDTFAYPGCDIDIQTFKTRWKVYNTACNSGELCSPKKATVQCTDHTEAVVCHSYRYTILNSYTTTATFNAGDTTITITDDPVILGLTVGALITGNGIDTGTTLVGPITAGTSITLSKPTLTSETSITITFGTANCPDISTCDVTSTCHPTDCYLDESNKCIPCEDNYPTFIEDVAHPGTGCPTWPSAISNICKEDYVRTKTDALNYYNANGKYLLCIDATLVALSNTLSDPYAVKTESYPVKVVDASTKDYYVYDLLDIQSKVINSKDPTPTGDTATNTSCLTGYFLTTGVKTQTYLIKDVNTPSTPPENYDPINGIALFNPSPEGKCNDYGATAPLMYMFGNDMPAPSGTPPFCNDCTSDPKELCCPDNFTGDYWNVGSPNIPYGEVNNTLYQSYWFSFTATALQPTIIIKSKLFYKSGEYDPSDVMVQGDIRIDVLEGSPLGNVMWSTGMDSVNPATYYYTGAEEDQGVLIIGDVANSTGQPTTANQLPLIAGTTYYVHIYLLDQSIAKLNKAAIANSLYTGCDSECPCYFPQYGWMNLCMNSAISDTTKSITLPETYELECKYDIHFRINEVVDTGCEIQTFEYGDFAYWESLNKTYPNNPEVWGDLCGKPIRHFKFPDCLVTSLQDRDLLIPTSGGVATDYGPFNFKRKAKIYPLGIRVNAEDVKAWLLWAVAEGLITEEERLSITGYKIVRGNRVGNKSIIGKGLLYDMWRYKEYDYVNNSYSSINTYYPSYPFNDLRPDYYLERSGSPFAHPFNGAGNNRFAFLSPETTFNSPNIGVELKFEAVNFGDSLGNFYQVKDHPKYVLLSNGGIALASSLAALNLSADLLIDLGDFLGNYTVGLANTIPVGSIVSFVGGFLNLVPKFFVYAKQWKDIITNFGVPKNFAMYYAAVGNYHSSGDLGKVENTGNKRRLISNSLYLLAGNLGTSDSGVLSKINNYQREDSVYLYLKDRVDFAGTALLDPFLRDSSRFIMSDGGDFQPCVRKDRKSNVASYYGSIKHYLPDQYGDIHDITWIYTGECVKIKWDDDQSFTGCFPIYGGDTFICRMTQKRKIPFFLDNAVGVTTGVDFQYQHLSNITDAKYYFNSIGESPTNSSSIQFTEVEHNFDCVPVKADGSPKTPLYLNGSFYLFSYGVTSFITESSFNLNYRYATDTKFADFYPHQSDIENWTQEYRVPIETPNRYLYNMDYSKQNRENFFCTQPVLYNNADCITEYKNRVINSLPDYDSDYYTDSWRIYLGNDYHDFPLVNGQLIGLTGIERDKVLLRFQNTSLVFNAYYTMATDAGLAQISTGSMFSQKPLEYAKTEIGYGGTQNHAFVSTQYGHFWVDAKRSAVFHLPPGDSGLQEISQSFNSFFNNNLPFFILKDFPTFNVDNNFKDVGIAICWDNKFDRLFITKLDFNLVPSQKGKVFFDETLVKFYILVDDARVYIDLTDETYFCNKSWTIAYSPMTKTWISFYSFVPNYYIGHENYFQSGINFPQDGDLNKIGVWNHLITNKSYQVFYGQLYPYITDVVLKDELINKQLQSIEYQTDYLRFQNEFDYFYNPRVTFNKLLIWSENQNSGILELIPQVPNNMSQGVMYPKYTANATSILVSRKENNWRVNQFSDIVKSKNNDVPIMIYNCHPYLKEVNPIAINYFKPTFQRSKLTSDYFTLRFINDVYSNYKVINKWFINKVIKSIS